MKLHQYGYLSVTRSIIQSRDHTTILNFLYLQEHHGLGRKIFEEVNSWLAHSVVLVKEGILMDATIIWALGSTKNKIDERDPEMHQTKEGNKWHFRLKAHIGIDARKKLTHSFEINSSVSSLGSR